MTSTAATTALASAAAAASVAVQLRTNLRVVIPGSGGPGGGQTEVSRQFLNLWVCNASRQNTNIFPLQSGLIYTAPFTGNQGFILSSSGNNGASASDLVSLNSIQQWNGGQSNGMSQV